MDVDDRVPLFFRGRDEHAISQEARVINDDVEAAEAVEGLFDDALSGREFGDAVGIRDRFPAHRLDLVGHLLGGAVGASFAVV